MKIVHIDRQRGWTGQTNRTLNVLTGLRARGIDATLIAHAGSALADRARQRGVEPIEVPLYGHAAYASILAIRRACGRSKGEILHCHGPRDQLLSVLARPLGAGRKMVRTRHNHLPLGSGWFSRLLFVPCDAVVCISEYIRELSLSDGLPAKKLTTIRTAVDTTRWTPGEPDPALRRELGFGANEIVIGHSSTLVERKGVDWLLQAFAQHVQADPAPPARLLIVGEAFAKWQPLAEQLGLGDRVIFTGFQAEPQRFLRLMDLFIIPSREEGLGTAAVEAMACGLPVIGSRVGGIPESVTPEVGLLFEPGDVAGLADCMAQLASDPAARRRLGEASRARAISEFSVEVMVDRLVELYRDLAT